METVHRTYRFELGPGQKQKELLDKHFDCVPLIFNCFLDKRKKQYQVNKKSDNCYS